MARKKKKQETESEDQELKPGNNQRSGHLAAFWKDQIEDYFGNKNYKRYIERGEQVIKRYRDERSAQQARRDRRLNILWANVKILGPAVYGKLPQPVVERKFLQHDPVGRLSSIMLERATRSQIGENGLHNATKRAVLDYLLSGRGVTWCRYEPEIGTGDSIPVLPEDTLEDALIDADGDDEDAENTPQSEKLEATGEQLLSEQAPVDYIDWKDFIFLPSHARTWDEVQAIAKRVYISKKEARDRFGKDIGDKIKPNDIADSSQERSMNYSRFEDLNHRSIIIYEIWNKTDRKIYWVSFGYDYLCDVKDDFLKLKKFFPVPMPLDATLTNDVYFPVPDYWEYQDQAIQIDELTQRLALLTQACKIAGTYDASNAPLKRLLDQGVENELLPVDAWAAFAEKGGVKGGISLLPIDEIQKVIQTLQTVRAQLIQDLDLVTGLTDVQRGTTDSRETLGGIRLKNNTTGSRLSERQNEVARFVRDTVAITAEIVAKHFDDKTIIESSGVLFDDDMQPEAIQEELKSKIEKFSNNQPQQQQLPMPPMPSQMGPPQAPQPMLPGPPGAAPGAAPMPMGQMPSPPQMAPGGPPMGPSMNGPTPMRPMGNSPEQLMALLKPDMIIAMKIEKAIKLLRSDVPRGYRIDIETDSTIFGDAAQERQDAIEFIGGVTQFLTAAAALAEKMPEATPMFGRMLQFGVRKFRTGRDLESSIDTFVRKMDTKAKNAETNPQPSPEMMELQAEMAKQKLALQGQEQAQQANMQKLDAEHKMQIANDQRDLQKQQMEDQRAGQLAQQQQQLEERKASISVLQMDREHNIKMTELERQAQYNEAAHKQKMEQLRVQAAEKEKARKDKANKPKKKAA